ncbi:MAG: hypothetical protein JSW40_03080, partial [Candidatus Omnitrophota bacterium]
MDESGSKHSGIFNEVQQERFKPVIRFIAWIVIFCFLYQDFAAAYGPDYVTSRNLQFQSSTPPVTHPVTQEPLNLGSLLSPLKALFIQDVYAAEKKNDPPPPPPPKPSTSTNTGGGGGSTGSTSTGSSGGSTFTGIYNAVKSTAMPYINAAKTTTTQYYNAMQNGSVGSTQYRQSPTSSVVTRHDSSAWRGFDKLTGGGAEGLWNSARRIVDQATGGRDALNRSYYKWIGSTARTPGRIDYYGAGVKGVPKLKGDSTIKVGVFGSMKPTWAPHTKVKADLYGGALSLSGPGRNSDWRVQGVGRFDAHGVYGDIGLKLDGRGLMRVTFVGNYGNAFRNAEIRNFGHGTFQNNYGNAFRNAQISNFKNATFSGNYQNAFRNSIIKDFSHTKFQNNFGNAFR